MIIVPADINTPAAITVRLYTPYFGVDLTTVTAVAGAVTRRDGTATSFAFTIASQTANEMLVQYRFTGSGEITSTGIYYIALLLTVPGGHIPANTVTMYVGPGPQKLEDTAWISATAIVP